MVKAFKKRRKLPPKPRMADATKGRLVLLYGPPASGVSTAAEVLAEASENDIYVVPWDGDVSRGVADIQDCLRNGADVVLVDVASGFLLPEDIQTLIDEGLIWNKAGCAIRLHVDAEECASRAKQGQKEEIPSEESVREWGRGMLDVEDKLRQHSIPYFMVPAFDLAETVRLIALRANITN